MNPKYPIRIAIVTCMFVGVAGCSGERFYPIRGKITFSNGQPLDTGRVIVITPGRTTGSWGSVNTDGTFEIGTHSHNDGVPAGVWTVVIENAVTTPPATWDKPYAFVSRPLIDPKYATAATSGLSFTVPDQTTWDIVVEKPAKESAR